MDFASAILGAGHGWLMFAEKTIYEDSLTINKGTLNFKTQQNNTTSTLLRFLGAIISGCLLFTIIKRYQYQHEIKKLENYGHYYSSIWKNPSIRLQLCLELLVCSIIMPPFLNLVVSMNVNGVTVSYTLDMLISSLILLKSYTLLRVYEHVSMWTNFTAKKTTLPFGLETNYRFAFKADVRSNNLLIFLVVAVIFTSYCGTLIFNFERFYYEPRLSQTWFDFFKEYQNSLWLELNTLTGVGDGDGYAVSIPARIVGAFCCFASLFSISLIIKIMYARLKLTPKEASAYHVLHQDIQMHQTQLQARNVII